MNGNPWLQESVSAYAMRVCQSRSAHALVCSESEVGRYERELQVLLIPPTQQDRTLTQKQHVHVMCWLLSIEQPKRAN